MPFITDQVLMDVILTILTVCAVYVVALGHIEWRRSSQRYFSDRLDAARYLLDTLKYEQEYAEWQQDFAANGPALSYPPPPRPDWLQLF